MAKAKNRKTNVKRKYAICNGNHYLNKVLADETADSSSLYRIPPELAPYALCRASQIPPSLRKYWNHRTSLFSYFDGLSPSGLMPLLDEQSWFSITPEAIAARISHRCKSTTILDAFCGAGGNAIQFAYTCQQVIAIDNDPIKLLLAKHNAEVYGVKEKITFLLGDWRDFIKDYLQARDYNQGITNNEMSNWLGCEKWSIDVIFLSPPWGGIDYRLPSKLQISDGEKYAKTNEEYDYYPLCKLEPDGGVSMLKLAKEVTPSVCLYLPRTIDLKELILLESDRGVSADKILIDVEEQWLADHCKALACYFGPLASISSSSSPP